MDRDRYAQVKKIFMQATDLESDKREEFLNKACGNDLSLFEEVVSLLEFDSPETLIGGLSSTDVGLSSPPSNKDLSHWVGRRLGKYEILKVLATGGMGIVLEARDITIERRAAIKILHDSFCSDALMQQRFLEEARAAGNLNHPNVVTIYGVNTDNDINFLAMEFAGLGSTDDHLKQKGPFTSQEASRIIYEAGLGLAAAHEAGLVHRDIKPANLLMMEDGLIKISDFGVAKLADRDSLQLTRAGQIIGTPNYMSPEQCEGTHVDKRSDIYSLGATYYSLLVGKMPYEDRPSLVALIHAHCNADPPDPREVDPSLPYGCTAVVLQAMAKSPEHRYQSAEEMLKAIDNLEQVTKHAACSNHWAQNNRKLSRRKVVLLGFLACLAMVASGFYLTSDSRNRNTNVSVELANQEPIRIGIIHSLSGTMANTEEVLVDAYMLAIEEINQQGGILGREIIPLVRDGESNDKQFGNIAEELIEEQNVSTLFGCCTSSSRKAVKEVVESKNHLLIYSANHEGVEYSPNIIYLGGAPSQTIIPCVNWAYAFGKYRKFFIVGSDYVFPRVTNEIVKDEIQSLGAELVGETYLPLGSTDVMEVIGLIKEAKPDAIINTISGDTQKPFVTKIRAQGITATQFTTGLGEQNLRKIYIPNLLGDYSSSTYFQSIDTPINREFVNRFKNKFGKQRVISAGMETAYNAIHLWAKAVSSSADLSPTGIRDAMFQAEYDGPGGKITIDPNSHYAFRYNYMGNIESDGQFHIQWKSADPVAPKPFPESRSVAEWNELLEQLFLMWDGNWSEPIR